jgi:hypothetical protein
VSREACICRQARVGVSIPSTGDADNSVRAEERDMSEKTKQITPDRMEQYFNGFSKRFLQKDNRTADVEVLGMDLGDQVEGEGVRLIGITYEPNTKELEVELETGDLRSYKPKEVWAIEEDDGFIRALEIVRDDDTKEIVRVRRQAIRRAD